MSVPPNAFNSLITGFQSVASSAADGMPVDIAAKAVSLVVARASVSAPNADALAPDDAVSATSSFIFSVFTSSAALLSTAGLFPFCLKFTSIGRMQVWSLHAP